MMKHKIVGSFVPHRVSMLRSPAWAVLSLSERRVLDRLEIESSAGAGQTNGAVVCPHRDFIEAGVHNHAVGPSVRALEALGFIAVRRGKAGVGRQRAASIYRLTYLPSAAADPTDDWRKITFIEEARVVAQTARKAVSPSRSAKKSQCRKPPQSPVSETTSINLIVSETTTGEASVGNHQHSYLDTSLPRGDVSQKGEG